MLRQQHSKYMYTYRYHINSLFRFYKRKPFTDLFLRTVSSHDKKNSIIAIPIKESKVKTKKDIRAKLEELLGKLIVSTFPRTGCRLLFAR